MKFSFCLSAMLLLFASESVAQTAPEVQSKRVLIDLTGGVSFTGTPVYSRWSEILLLKRSPDLRSALEVRLGVSVKLDEFAPQQWALGGEASYGFMQDVVDNYGGFRQAKLTATLFTLSPTLSYIFSQQGAALTLTGGVGLLSGTIVQEFETTQTHTATGVNFSASATYGIALNQTFFALFGLGLRGGITGNAQNASGALEFIDIDGRTKPVTLSYYAVAVRLGVGFWL